MSGKYTPVTATDRDPQAGDVELQATSRDSVVDESFEASEEHPLVSASTVRLL